MSSGAHQHGSHQHGSHQHGSMGNSRRLLVLVLALNGGYMVVEIVGGILFGSLALLADAAHMASDAAGIFIALIAQTLILRPPSDRHTFGLIRSEVLAAQANGVLLVATGGWIMWEAFQRIGQPPEIEGGGVAIVAMIGLAINLGSAWLLFGARHENLNMRGAFLHMTSDAAGSVAAVAAGLAALLGQAYWVDPAVSILIAVLVLWSAWGLLAEATQVLLEGAPPGLATDEIVDAVVAIDGVDDLHHLHLWRLSSDEVALSGHLVVNGERTLHEAQHVGDRARTLLADRFGVEHATLELECHSCDDDEHRSRLPTG